MPQAAEILCGYPRLEPKGHGVVVVVVMVVVVVVVVVVQTLCMTIVFVQERQQSST